MSVAIASCIPRKEDPVCFVSKGDEGDLVKKMLDYLENLADDAYMILKESFSMFLMLLKPVKTAEKKNLSKNLMLTFKS